MKFLMKKIDLRETENRIILTRGNEYCCLDAGDKKNAFSWLNKICRYCGFDEITNHYEPNKLNKKLNQKSSNKLIVDSPNTSIINNENDTSYEAPTSATTNTTTTTTTTNTNTTSKTKSNLNFRFVKCFDSYLILSKF